MNAVNRLRISGFGRRLERALRFRGVPLLTVGDTNDGFWKPRWETVDLVRADHICDVRKERRPFADCSVAVGSCSHIAEHLPFPDASSHFYREVFRIPEACLVSPTSSLRSLLRCLLFFAQGML